VDENPVRYSVFADNTGTSSTGYYRTGVGFQHANMFDSDQVLSAQAITSPTQPSDVLIAGLGYHIPVYGLQGTLDFIGGYSDVNAGTVQNLFTVTGSGTVFLARYTQYLPRIDTYDQKLMLGWDWRAYKNNVGLEGVSGSLVPDVTVQPLSLTYTGRFSQVGQDLSFYLAAAQNVPGGTDGGQDAFTAQRAGASANYLVYRAGAVYTRVLPGDFRLRAAANGQYTNYLLVPGEQFGMGGMDSVRGFFERETANDIGNRFSLEGYSPDFGAHIGDAWGARALVFTDMAHGRDNNPPQNANNGLASVGVGLRANQGKSLGIRMDWAYVTNAAGSRPEGSTRVDFAIAYSF
jgi:hemolysin activation/secretion protein